MEPWYQVVGQTLGQIAWPATLIVILFFGVRREMRRILQSLSKRLGKDGTIDIALGPGGFKLKLQASDTGNIKVVAESGKVTGELPASDIGKFLPPVAEEFAPYGSLPNEK